MSALSGLDRLVVVLITVFTMSSCQDHSVEEPGESTNPGNIKEPLIEANKAAVQTEEQQIEDLLRRYHWDMNETHTGLRYMIDDDGYGRLIREGDRVKLDYAVKLINGDVVYTSQESGPMEFTVGKEDVISGLHEGVQLLRKGAKARFVIPSHLGYGLIGDNDRIGKKATLIYKVHVLEVE